MFSLVRRILQDARFPLSKVSQLPNVPVPTVPVPTQTSVPTPVRPSN